MSLPRTELAVIKAALAEATPDSWTDPESSWGSLLCEYMHLPDGLLIAAAPRWLAELVSRVERAEAVLERIAGWEYGYSTCYGNCDCSTAAKAALDE